MTPPNPSPPPTPARVQVPRLPERPALDGRPDPAWWRAAPGYPLAYSRDRPGRPREGGEVKFGWTPDGLYLAAHLEDRDLVAMNDRDEQLHFRYGEVRELFVKPVHDSYYW